MGDLALAARPEFRTERRRAPLPSSSIRRARHRDEVAASLAACDTLDGVVVVGADEVLDRALATRPAAQPCRRRRGEGLRHAIEAAFEPVEMTDLHALLVADPELIPRRMARELVRGLNESPGRRLTAWSEALAAGLAAMEAERREVVEQRRGLLMPACKQEEPLPMTELRTRLDVLSARALRAPRSVARCGRSVQRGAARGCRRSGQARADPTRAETIAGRAW